MIGIVLLADLDTQNAGVDEKGGVEGFLKKVGEGVSGNGELTVPMVESLVSLVRYLRSEYGIEYLGGHDEVDSRRHCPGNVGLDLVSKMRQTFKFHKPGK